MIRSTTLLLTLFVLCPQPTKADETSVGTCMIINTTDHPIVIGLYQPLESGIAERIVNVPAKTEMRDVPVPMVDDAQFVIAYKATMEDDEITRSNPIEIFGHKRMRYIKNAKDPNTPNVLIQYRGGSSIGFTRDAFNTALYLPDTEVESRRVLKDANHTQKLVKTPLVQKVYTAN